MPTLEEEAKACPQCEQPGFIATTSRKDDGGRIDFYECANKRCTWLGERWAVQVNADGTIPQVRHSPEDKMYKPLSADQLAAGQRIVEDAVRKDLRNVE